MEKLSNLEQAIQILEVRGEGVIVAEEQPDGKMKYIVGTEAACYALYNTEATLRTCRKFFMHSQCSFEVICRLGSHHQGALHSSK